MYSKCMSLSILRNRRLVLNGPFFFILYHKDQYKKLMPVYDQVNEAVKVVDVTCVAEQTCGVLTPMLSNGAACQKRCRRNAGRIRMICLIGEQPPPMTRSGWQ